VRQGGYPPFGEYSKNSQRVAESDISVEMTNANIEMNILFE
jgi:hypothetical protein